jgi:hypothetical protein
MAIYMIASPKGAELNIVTLQLDDRGGGKVAIRGPGVLAASSSEEMAKSLWGYR